MKIFLAWSGDRSRRVANALKEWLEDLLDDTVCWESEYDIESGAYWHNEILKAVEESKAGILCLTSDMFDAPWVMFEAGALGHWFKSTMAHNSYSNTFQANPTACPYLMHCVCVSFSRSVTVSVKP